MDMDIFTWIREHNTSLLYKVLCNISAELITPNIYHTCIKPSHNTMYWALLSLFCSYSYHVTLILKE